MLVKFNAANGKQVSGLRTLGSLQEVIGPVGLMSVVVASSKEELVGLWGGTGATVQRQQGRVITRRWQYGKIYPPKALAIPQGLEWLLEITRLSSRRSSLRGSQDKKGRGDVF